MHFTPNPNPRNFTRAARVRKAFWEQVDSTDDVTHARLRKRTLEVGEAALDELLQEVEQIERLMADAQASRSERKRRRAEWLNASREFVDSLVAHYSRVLGRPVTANELDILTGYRIESHG